MGLAPRAWAHLEYRDRLLVPLERVTNAMERTGVCVDRARLHQIAQDARKEEALAEGQLRDFAQREVNWASWQQLVAFLHTDPSGLCLPPSPYWKKGEVEKGEIKTDDRALEWLAGHHPEHRVHINLIRQLRRWQRTAMYAEDWLDKALPHPDGTWRLHPSYGLGSDHDNRPGAKTGRFAVKNPPLNQVPRVGSGPAGTLREAFVAPPGYRLVVVDYSQLEVVILAHLCAVLFGDGPLVRYMREGKDIHAAVARRAFETEAPLDAFKVDPALKLLRTLAKAVVYGNNYGKSRFSTSVFLPDGEPMGEDRANRLVHGLAQEFPEIGAYQGMVRDWITQKLYITSLFGRVMKCDGAASQRKGDRNRAWRQALNYPMQSGGQEIMALALIALEDDGALAECQYTLSMPVHDEVVGWAREDRAEDALARVKVLMEGPVELRVPLRTEGHTGSNWAEAK